MLTTLTVISLLSAASPAKFVPPARPYDVQHYRIEVRMGAEGEFKNSVAITLKPTRGTKALEFDAWGLSVSTVTVDGAAATFKATEDAATSTGTLTVTAAKPLAAGKEAIVVIAYAGKAGTSHQGFFTVKDPSAAADSQPLYFTHFEPLGAQRFFPCNDQPSDKATTEVLAIIDQKSMAISNGKLLKNEAFAEGGKNLRRVHWSQEQPHSTYLVALAIGGFEAVEVSKDIPSTLWVLKGRKDRAFVASDSLRELYTEQSQAVGARYPFSKLDVVTVPSFYWNGMENSSVIFQRESRTLIDLRNDQLARPIIVGLLAHEMAHQWFGNSVTCKWWDEAWLNEGFATWLGQKTADEVNGNDQIEVYRTVGLLDRYFAQEDGLRARPLVGGKITSAEEAFDATSYLKGANVLRMLELWLGKAEMKKSIKAYLEKHAGDVATSDDFFKAVYAETKKEKELKGFKESWLKMKGYPVIFPESSYGSGKLTITIRQQNNHPSQKGHFVFKLPITVARSNEPRYTKTEVITVDKPKVTVTLDVPGAPEWINWNKDFGALVKVNAASIPEAQWVDAARSDADPTWRLQAAFTLLGELGNPTSKGETLPSDSAMNAVKDVLAKDPSPYVREALLEKLSNTRFKTLPSALDETLLQLARRPDELDGDAVGYIRVRNAAMETLGRTGSDQAHQYLIKELSKREVDLNYLAGFAAGVARIDSGAAQATLRSALTTQKSQGFPFYRRVAAALGGGRGIETVTMMSEVLMGSEGNDELARYVLSRAARNAELKAHKDYADLVRDLTLDEGRYGEDLRCDFVRSLDDVKTDAARAALTVIAEKSSAERVRQTARVPLAANWPAPPAEKPAKGGKKKK